MEHVALNLDAHAAWVGNESAAAQLEHEAMLRVAAAYRGIARAAFDAAALMRGLGDLPPVHHDPARWDRAAFARWMRQKIQLQRALAELLLEHVDASERALDTE
jgi:hypothetical protein